MTRDALASMVVDGYLAQLGGWAGDNHWSWSIVTDLVHAKPDVAWPMLLELIARAPDGNLSEVAAGPLEDYLSEHGPRVIDAVEAEAQTNPRLRHALAMVWQLGMTDDVWSRVQALADSTLAVAMELEPPDDWTAHRIEVRLDWMPAFTAGVLTDVDAKRLLEALREAKPDGQDAWRTPVVVELRVWSGSEPLPVAPIDLLAQAVDLLETGGIIENRDQVRQGRFVDLRGAVPELLLEVQRMPEDQIEAFDSTEPFDEAIVQEDIETLRAELEALRAAGPAAGDGR